MKSSTRLAIVLAISITFFFVEAAIGFRIKSLALIADAFHYLNDIVAYLIAFIAAYVQGKEYKPSGFTYALHRAELVGAFFNGVFLLSLALSIFLQSLERFINMEHVKEPFLMLIVGCVGLTLNLLSAYFVHDHHDHGHGHDQELDQELEHDHGNSVITPVVSLTNREIGPDNDIDMTVIDATISIDIEEQNLGDIHAFHNHARLPPPLDPHGNMGILAVFIHVLGDAANNVGVIIAAIIMWKIHSQARFYADPATSLIISLVIFAGAIPLTLRSGRILLEASPIHLNLDNITEDLLALHSVVSIHDLHVWQLSHKVIVASLHVEVPVGTTLSQWGKIEGRLRECMAAYGVSHLTVGPEVSTDTIVGPMSEGKSKSTCHGLLGCSAVVAGSQNSLRHRGL
jgi:zinc transporter 1